MAIINGTIFDDTLDSTAAGDAIFGGKGNDFLNASHGSVTLHGGDDDDVLQSFGGGNLVELFGDAGDDDLIGGFGSDDLLFGGDGNDFFFLTGGKDVFSGDLGTDVLGLSSLDTGSGITFTLGTGGQGAITSSNFVKTTRYTGMEGLAGGNNNDSLAGNAGANLLYGSTGDDSLNGKNGADALWGEEGHDVLFGGAGTDLFVFTGGPTRRDIAASADTVTDFSVTDDSLVFWSREFSGLTATGSAVTIGNSTVFALAATQFAVQTTKVATSLAVRLIYDQDDGLLYYDPDGALAGYRPALVADLGVGLALTATDFFLL